MTDVVELHDCVRKKTKNLGKLLKSGAIPDAEIEGNTPLLVACYLGRAEKAELLLRYGANVNFKNCQGWTPLMVATLKGFPLIVDKLLSKQADVKLTNNHRQNALMAACTKAVPEYGIEKHCKKEITIPDALPMGSAQNTPNKGRRAVVESLLRKGCDMNVTDDMGCTALQMAVNAGYAVGVELLLDEGADFTIAVPEAFRVNREYMHQGGTLLHLACSRKPLDYDTITCLVSRMDSARVNAQDAEGWTALSVAVSMGRGRATKMLVESKIDSSNILDARKQDIHALTHGKTYFELIPKRDFKEVAEALLEHPKVTQYEREDCLIRAAEMGNIPIIEILAADMINLNAVRNNRNALFAAVETGEAEVVEWLSNRGADMSVRDAQGYSALHLAARCGRLNVVKILLSTSDVDAETDEEDTALMLAASNGFASIVSYLLRDGQADPSFSNNKDMSAMMMAAKGGHEAIVGRLLNCGSSQQDVDRHQRNCALVLAAEEGHTEVVVKLASRGCDRLQAQEALVAACRGGFLATVKVLLLFGYGEDENEAQAARAAANDCGHADLVKFLDYNSSEKVTHKNLSEADSFVKEAYENWDEDVVAMEHQLKKRKRQAYQPTPELQKDGYLGNNRLLLAHMIATTKGKMSRGEVRSWFEVNSECFPKSYEDQGISLGECEIDHILPRSLGGVDHPYNYYILPRDINRDWSGWWTREKRSYMGKTNYKKFQHFVLWTTSEAELRRVDYNDFGGFGSFL